jgi:hypothetical protein
MVVYGRFQHDNGGADKQRGRVVEPDWLSDFGDFIYGCDPMELEFKGSPYIWTNRHTGRHDRLDRAQATAEWL